MRDQEEGADAGVRGGADEGDEHGRTGDEAGEHGGDQDASTPYERTASKLGSLVQMEAHRMVSEASIRPDPERLAEGWERRFITDRRRAEEAVDLYRELGYEVVADPVRPEDLAGECKACRIVAMMSFKSIYTRRRPDGKDVDAQENRT